MAAGEALGVDCTALKEEAVADGHAPAPHEGSQGRRAPEKVRRGQEESRATMSRETIEAKMNELIDKKLAKAGNSMEAQLAILHHELSLVQKHMAKSVSQLKERMEKGEDIAEEKAQWISIFQELKYDLPQPAPGDDTCMLEFVDGMLAELKVL
ncbi:MAG TPA: hypothetical protein VNX28_03435 [Gemmataceae bacterium]|nr:hypothetical protein [Gemmataceae bacterium]